MKRARVYVVDLLKRWREFICWLTGGHVKAYDCQGWRCLDCGRRGDQTDD